METKKDYGKEVNKIHWRKVAYYFATGAFNVNYYLWGWNKPIKGYCNGKFGFMNLSGDLIWMPIEECILYARPIDDMTDRELDQVMFLGKGMNRYERIEYFKKWPKYPSELKGLLEIGVYPFAWPDDGSVIEVRDNEY